MTPTSIGFLLRRTTAEAAYVAVPVTGDVMTDGKLDWAKLKIAAVELGYSPDCDWMVETHAVDLHPAQKPAPGEG